MNKQKMIKKLQEMGLNVMPIAPYSKKPLTDWTRLQREKYTGEFPDNCNLAVICGEISFSLFVIDLDDVTLFDEFKEYHDNTFIVKTGSRGYHIYFRSNGVVPSNRKFDDKSGRHIDIKSHGGYVLAPSSIHPDTKREYVILSDKPILTINPNEIMDKLIKLGFDIEKTPVEDIIKNGSQKGSRNDDMFRAACHLMRKSGIYGTGLEYEMRNVNALNKPPLPDEELLLITKQAEKYEMKNIKVIKLDEQKSDTPKKLTMQQITPELEGELIEFEGRIMAVGVFETYTKEAEVQCPKCCKPEVITCDEYRKMKLPNCYKHKIEFQVITKKTEYLQQMRIQEFLETARNNSPREYDAEIIDKNVGEAFMNDRMIFIAKFRSLPQKNGYNHIVFDVVSMKPLEQHEGCMPSEEEVKKWKADPDIYRRVVNSIAPELYMKDEIIESFMLAVTGGMSLNGKRALIHCGLIGDAQLGKSELYKFIHNMIPASGLTIGRQCSGTGLTIGMHKMYNGASVPMAGFLPSHTGKPVIIDEADKLKTEDLDYILECMEQQTATQNKTGSGAGITLPASCPVLIGGNPVRGKYNSKIPMMDNFNFSAPFLSRLDILWLMVDPNDPELDTITRKHIREYKDNIDKYMPMEELQRFFTYVKTIKVTLPKELESKIDDLHAKMRPLNKKDGIPIGWRQFYGLNRLVTACAALHLRDVVIEEDFNIIQNIIIKSLASLGMNMETGEVEQIQHTKDTKLTQLLEAWSECCDEDHTVDKDQFLKQLSTKPLYEGKDLDRIWLSMEKSGKYVIDSYGRWRNK